MGWGDWFCSAKCVGNSVVAENEYILLIDLKIHFCFILQAVGFK